MSNLLNNIGLSLITFVSRIISGSVVYIILARILDLNGFGLLSFGVTFAGLLTVMAEFGFSLMSQRDIPQNRFELNSYVFNTLIQKVGFSTIAIIGGLIYLNVLFTGDNLKVGIIFIAIAIVTSNNMYLFSVFRAKNNFKIESWLSVLYSIVILIVLVFFYYLNLDIYFIAYGLLIGRSIQLLVLVLIYRKKFKLSFEFSLAIQSYLLKNSFSFGGHYIIGVFYFTIDNQLIAYYAGNDALAIYQAYFKIVLILLSINDLLNNVFIPFLSCRYKKGGAEFTSIALLLNYVIFTLGLILFVFVNLYSKGIVTILYSEKYLPSLSLVLPLSLMLLIRVISSVYSVFLTISDHQNLRVLTVFISLVVNVTLNLLIIPKYGFVGAAYVSLATHLVLIGLYLFFCYKYLKSLLIEFNMVIFLCLTTLVFLAYTFFDVKLNLIYSTLIMLVWLTSMSLMFNKYKINQLRLLFKQGYL